jgi:hypothetical protein
VPARYLLDEHFPHAYMRALRRADPSPDVWAIGEPGAPPKRTPDPEILRWCEAGGVMLITNDRRTMAKHLEEHLARGGHILGVFMANPERHMARLIEDLVLVAAAAKEGEFSDHITYLPLE